MAPTDLTSSQLSVTVDTEVVDFRGPLCKFSAGWRRHAGAHPDEESPPLVPASYEVGDAVEVRCNIHRRQPTAWPPHSPLCQFTTPLLCVMSRARGEYVGPAPVFFVVDLHAADWS